MTTLPTPLTLRLLHAGDCDRIAAAFAHQGWDKPSAQYARYLHEQDDGAREVCGTPYTVDTGTGMGRVVQDCEYQVYDDMCSYTTLQLAVINTVVSQGEGLAPKWPVANLAAEQKLGDRRERYICEFKGDGKTYGYTVRSLNEYEQCQVGSRWKLQVNSFGDVVGAEQTD